MIVMIVILIDVAAKKKLLQPRSTMRTIHALSGFMIHLEKPNASNAAVDIKAARKKATAGFGACLSFGSSF